MEITLTCLGSFMTETIMPLSKAVEGYRMFDTMEVTKVIFEADK